MNQQKHHSLRALVGRSDNAIGRLAGELVTAPSWDKELIMAEIAYHRLMADCGRECLGC